VEAWWRCVHVVLYSAPYTTIEKVQDQMINNIPRVDGNSITNANSEFHLFHKCDWTKHWSWSTLFKNVFICNNLIGCDKVVEIGAADSKLRGYLELNFNTRIRYIGYDINPPLDSDIKYRDVAKDGLVQLDDSVDAVVMAEVIEHFPLDRMQYVLEEAHRVGRKLILTTPSPHSPGELVWPDSHDHELTWDQLCHLLKISGWKLTVELGWHSRVPFVTSINTFDGMPMGLSRAINSMNIEPDLATQVAIVAERA